MLVDDHGMTQRSKDHWLELTEELARTCFGMEVFG
jgi:hypothetical protein